MDPLLYIIVGFLLFCFCLWVCYRFGADVGQEKQKELEELETRKWEAWKWRRTFDYFNSLPPDQQKKIFEVDTNLHTQLEDRYAKLSDRKGAMK